MDIDYNTLISLIHDPISTLPQSPILAAQALSEMSQREPVVVGPSGQDESNPDDDDDMSISSYSSSSSLSEPPDDDSSGGVPNSLQIDIKEQSVSPPALPYLSPRRSPPVVVADSARCAPEEAFERYSEERHLASDDGNGADEDTDFYQSDAGLPVKNTPKPRKATKRPEHGPKSRKRSRNIACEPDDIGLYLGPASGLREWVEALYKVGQGAEKLHVNELRRCVLCGVTSQNMRRHIQTDVKHGRLWVQKVLSKDNDTLCGQEFVIIIHFMISAIARLNSDINSGFSHTWTPAQSQAREQFLDSFEDVGIAGALQFRLTDNFAALRTPLKRWAKFLDEERKCSSCGQPFARKDSKKRHKCATIVSSSDSVSDLEDA